MIVYWTMHKASPTEFLQSGLAIMLDRVTANLGYVARARTKYSQWWWGLRLAPVCFDSSLPSPSTLILWKYKKFCLKTGQLYLWSFLTQLPWLVAPWSHFLIQWFGWESKDLLYWSQSKCALSVCLRVNFFENGLKCQYAALNIDFWNYIFYWKWIFFVT